MVIDRWDARDGGSYRYVHRDGDSEHAFHGVFHSMAIDKPFRASTGQPLRRVR